MAAECPHARIVEAVHVDIDFRLSPLHGEGHPYDSKHAGQVWSIDQNKEENNVGTKVSYSHLG